ncbi:MAG: hypothetical protein OHK0028_04740 [Deltaproteobacteria bacterium]
MRSPAVSEALRFAAEVSSDPSAVVTLWKALTGGMAVGCLPAFPVPEIPHAAGLLPVSLESPEDVVRCPPWIDALLLRDDSPVGSAPSSRVRCFRYPMAPPECAEAALDRIEELAEWAETVSGTPASEGSLWKSIRAYAARNALLASLEDRCGAGTTFLAPRERREIVRAGSFLPPEAFSRLLSVILGVDYEIASVPPEGERGDPRIVLAKRLP